MTFHAPADPRLYWAEQVKISATMREMVADRIPSRFDHSPIDCANGLSGTPPESLADCAWLGLEPEY